MNKIDMNKIDHNSTIPMPLDTVIEKEKLIKNEEVADIDLIHKALETFIENDDDKEFVEIELIQKVLETFVEKEDQETIFLHNLQKETTDLQKELQEITTLKNQLQIKDTKKLNESLKLDIEQHPYIITLFQALRDKYPELNDFMPSNTTSITLNQNELQSLFITLTTFKDQLDSKISEKTSIVQPRMLLLNELLNMANSVLTAWRKQNETMISHMTQKGG